MALHIETGNRRSAGGFTLIELLVVMVIIASLLAIAVPRYFRSLDRAQEVVLAQDLAVMREAIDHFYGDQGKYPESLDAMVEARYLRSLPVDPLTKSADTWTFVYDDDPEIGGIKDVRSGAEGEDRHGIPFSDL